MTSIEKVIKELLKEWALVMDMAKGCWHENRNTVDDRKGFECSQLGSDFRLGGDKIGRARSLQIGIDIGEVAGKGERAHSTA